MITCWYSYSFTIDQTSSRRLCEVREDMVNNFLSLSISCLCCISSASFWTKNDIPEVPVWARYFRLAVLIPNI